MAYPTRKLRDTATGATRSHLSAKSNLMPCSAIASKTMSGACKMYTKLYQFNVCFVIA